MEMVPVPDGCSSVSIFPPNESRDTAAVLAVFFSKYFAQMLFFAPDHQTRDDQAERSPEQPLPGWPEQGVSENEQQVTH
jgi:hypothetical protein